MGKVIEAKICIKLDRNPALTWSYRDGHGWRRPRRSESGDFLTNLKPGERRKGVVSSVVNFGAFVDLGGGWTASCTSPSSSWKHVDHPSSVVQVGDEM